MMRNRLFQKTSLLVLFIAVLLAGCGGSPTPVEFYTLNSLSGTTQQANPADAAQNIAIGIGPVKIPKILDRPQIVTRTGPNRLQMDEFHRWAGPLGENFARVVAENISILLPTDYVAVYPWNAGFNPRYQVAMDVSYFEGRWDKELRLEVFWRVSDPSNSKNLIEKKTVVQEPLPTKSYEALVAAKSRALATLSTEIAENIRDLPISGTPKE